ncbi:MAG: DUF3298 domain-containing protein [Patescibacteria group bacterium]
MTIRNGIIAILLAILIGVGGWYVFTHTSSLPHVLTESGDRLIKEDTEYYTVQAVYPNTTRLATRTDSTKAADERVVNTIESEIKDMLNGFKNQANKALTTEEKARLTEAKIKYSINLTNRPYNSGSFVSYEFDGFEDTGGAHPINFYKTFVFDLKGNSVELDDLFTSGSGYLERIAAEAKKQIEVQLSTRGGEDATSTLVADGVAPRADNFANWVDDAGVLTIFIPPYQAAAYAAGSFEVRIPLDDLKDILKPGIQ